MNFTGKCTFWNIEQRLLIVCAPIACASLPVMTHTIYEADLTVGFRTLTSEETENAESNLAYEMKVL